MNNYLFTVVIRYFDKFKNKPIEQFVRMKRMMTIVVTSIFNALNEVVKEYEIKWENIISTCFDGAATMSGNMTGVQTKFKEKNPKYFFVHCYGHYLNLLLVDSIGNDNKVTFNFFGCIQIVFNFIEGSCTRHAVFENLSKWACRSEVVNAVKNKYSALLIAIKQITDNTKLLKRLQFQQKLLPVLSLEKCERKFKIRLQHNYQSFQIYNVDESGLSTVSTKQPKVISLTGKKRVAKLVTAERDAFLALIAECPNLEKAHVFTDYLVSTYIAPDSLFPPYLWAQEPSVNPRTTNVPESFHRTYNGQFYSPHPPTHVVISVLKKTQAQTLTIINSIKNNVHNPMAKKD
ncbi:uncharacterized protein LOC132925079 [Rhopalosiphum padi]|uniref:uncharacterized protein LOC132925079 n=1 Tax=Rhopalosiphum padi TaxID=40932 RepID=UPI00298ECF77|nr:uncharacterized protein LOC132925079 [Rhopalosiphum padi]